MAEALGISPSELPGAYPSQVLGTADVSPLEMAAAYATFADGGVYHSPLLITKVTTANGTAAAPAGHAGQPGGPDAGRGRHGDLRAPAGGAVGDRNVGG